MERVDESQFRQAILHVLKDEFSNYVVTDGENLLYKLFIDAKVIFNLQIIAILKEDKGHFRQTYW